jgi:hypothetical protein
VFRLMQRFGFSQPGDRRAHRHHPAPESTSAPAPRRVVRPPCDALHNPMYTGYMV